MKTIIRGLCLFWQAKIQLQRILLAIGGVTLTLLIFTQVVSRYLFNTALFGIEETASYIAVWLYFIGCSVGAEQREHISASLADLFVRSTLGRSLLSLLTCSLNTVLCGWMTVWAWQQTSWSLRMHMMSTELHFPIGYVQLAMPVGLGMMTLYFVVELIETLLHFNQPPSGART